MAKVRWATLTASAGCPRGGGGAGGADARGAGRGRAVGRAEIVRAQHAAPRRVQQPRTEQRVQRGRHGAGELRMPRRAHTTRLQWVTNIGVRCGPLLNRTRGSHSVLHVMMSSTSTVFIVRLGPQCPGHRTTPLTVKSLFSRNVTNFARTGISDHTGLGMEIRNRAFYLPITKKLTSLT